MRKFRTMCPIKAIVAMGNRDIVIRKDTEFEVNEEEEGVWSTCYVNNIACFEISNARIVLMIKLKQIKETTES